MEASRFGPGNEESKTGGIERRVSARADSGDFPRAFSGLCLFVFLLFLIYEPM